MRSINPTNGNVVHHVPFDTPAELEAALARSATAFVAWSTTSFERRARLVESLGKVLRRREEDLARAMVLEMGKPIEEARAEVRKSAGCCDYFAANGEAFLASDELPSDASLSFVAYEPLGTVLAVMPWNFPVWQVIRFAAPTLMAGNTALLKHAPSVPLTADLIVECFAEAGAPRGVFENLRVAEPDVAGIIADDRVAAVTLTGSVAAGAAVAELAGRAIKPSLLELGGSDPFIILGDADLDEAVAAAVFSRFLNNGQSCIAAKRIIAERTVHDEVLERVEAAVDRLAVGDPMDPLTDLGPIARSDLRATLHEQVLGTIQAGGTLVCGGTLPDGPGWFYPPTVLSDVTPGMRAFDEEVFGPVAAVIRATDEEHALQLAAKTRFGLGASIWTERERGIALSSRLRAGCVAVNGFVKSDPRLPFGGIKESGYGRELACAGIRAFVNAKTVWVR